MFYPTLISCLFAGIVFAALAVWLTTRRGNTIQDILKASQFAKAEALKVEIEGKLKLATNIPIVALYVLAAVVAIGLPSYTTYLAFQQADTVILQGNLADYVKIVDSGGGEKVFITPTSMYITPTGEFIAALRDTPDPQLIQFEAPFMYPLTLTVQYEKLNRKLLVRTASFSKPSVIPIDGKTAQLDAPVTITKKTTATLAPPNTPTQPPPEVVAAAMPPSAPALPR